MPEPWDRERIAGLIEMYLAHAVRQVRRRRGCPRIRFLGEPYLKKIGELREVMLQLLGLVSIVGSTDGFPLTELAIEFPYFGLPALAGKDLTISASEQDLEQAASPWRALASQLAKNPKADARLARAYLKIV